MSWTILTNTDGHFKFWSYNIETGEVHWGRIGTSGQHGNYPSSTILRRVDEKLSEGYVVFGENLPYSQPSPQQVRAEHIQAVNETIRQSRTESSTTERVRRTRTRPTTETTTSESTTTRQPDFTGFVDVPEFNRTHNVPEVSQSYKTDEKGFIKNYRQGYKRISFDSYMENIDFILMNKVINLDYTIIQPVLFKMAEKYYNRIPSDSQYSQPEDFKKLRDSNQPTFTLVFDKKKKECICIYGIRVSSVTMEFFSLKQDIQYRTTLLKEIMRRVGGLFPTSITEVIIKLKNPNTRNFIKEILPYYIEDTTTQSFKYKTQDLRRIPSVSSSSLRWIE